VGRAETKLLAGEGAEASGLLKSPFSSCGLFRCLLLFFLAIGSLAAAGTLENNHKNTLNSACSGYVICARVSEA
jgi:hypothetical protein